MDFSVMGEMSWHIPTCFPNTNLAPINIVIRRTGMRIHIGKTQITLEQGDISEQKTEVIAIPANDRLWMGGRVAEAIKQKAGEEVETEAMKQGPAEIGKIIITSAGDLASKHLFHAVIMGQDLSPTEATIGQGTYNILKMADEMGIQSLAMPAFGTGVGKFPAQQSAQTMVEQLINVLLDSCSIKDIHIVLHNEGIFKAFVREFERRFSR